MQTVYIDLLFILNVYINYFLLAASGRICSVQPRLIRIVLGALLGGFYAVLVFFPALGFLENLAVKIILAGSMVAVVYGSTSLRMYLKLLMSFLGLSFALAGFLLLIWVFASPAGMGFSNGVVYFNISPLLLIGSTAGCYLLIWLFSRIGPRKIPDSRQYWLLLQMEERTTRIRAMMDSGNELSDTRSGLPVIVVSLDRVASLMPDDVLAYYADFDSNLPISMTNPYWKSRFAVVPFHSVGADGLLPAFRPAMAEVTCEGQTLLLSPVLIAVTKQPLSDEYGALLCPRLSAEPKKRQGGKRYADKLA